MTPNAGEITTAPSAPQNSLLPRHLMTEQEKVKEWVRYWNACLLKMNALCAVLETDGPKTLGQVLRELKLERSEDLVKAIAQK